MESEKILLDTDIGCDIDDAICLSYLLSRKDCDLLGITTVNGDTQARAMLASAVCLAAGREDIPVFPGSKDTLLAKRIRKPVPQASALEKMPHKTDFGDGDYLSFMRRTILSHPGEVTLLAIGPMTNVGLLFAAYPETAAALKRLVLMGGNFSNVIAGMGWMESNTMCDPHAAELVYRAHPPVHRSVGCDVTDHLFMSHETVYELFPQNPLLKALLPMIDAYFACGPQFLSFHDACAAATIFSDDIVSWGGGLVEVELRADALMGMTVVKHAAYLNGWHSIATGINREAYFTDFYRTFGLTRQVAD